ncbi:putative DDE superfamily endonuclease [Monocercomonoides exilis]|uniref:putative DDE superfamily endonuclease n=1 Tax=Monocercomonoides exilis TaxID=2049356 RepID=UPI00355A199B|nr:putative DDE superfamily endonuclease [Monocercomonoides exilis]|eukprot:MONOS_11266.1-p1 / transcript=MONOS_11266.1 / gene=MONOS_11266 / organism=Monocercomonoides_exilis_PA203 / gene_product=unspecified product / transcript_product=unspecified product / location=Mono_scaffold00556:6781-7185(-) / protein_length=134 / sequence_SO=supercontig / SO=protein_coding / is_pseudo=false
MKEICLVVDCTVIPTNRSRGRQEFLKKYFSGMHHIFCVKAEVEVYPRIGTASTISSIYTKSTHDFTIFKDHNRIFVPKLGKSKILADSAFIGARTDIDAIVTDPVGTPELATHRVIVERFFGRLKTLFSIFRRQ